MQRGHNEAPPLHPSILHYRSSTCHCGKLMAATKNISISIQDLSKAQRINVMN